MIDWVETLETLHKAAGHDATLDADTDLVDTVKNVRHARALLDATEAHAVARLDQRGVTDRDYGLATGTWLAREQLIPPVAARNRVKVAKKLVTLTAVNDALIEGLISWEHVRVIAAAVANPRVGDQIAELENEIVEMARDTLFEHWRYAVLALVDLLDTDGPDPDDVTRNKLSVSDTLDGITHLNASFTKANGLTIRQAIETIADELFRDYQRNHKNGGDDDTPTRATLRALALVELCQRGLAVDLKTSRPPRPSVSLVIKTDDPDHITDLNANPVPGNALSTLLIDPDFTAIIINSLGIPINLGHSVRFATPAQRAAIAIRDGGCVFPGCDKPMAWLNMHHVKPYDGGHGGPSDIANFAGLCKSEHGVSHRNGWKMWATNDQWFIWESPTGELIWSQRHHQQRHGPFPNRT